MQRVIMLGGELMRYVLICDCGSKEFEYYDSKFVCTDCTQEYTEEQAGKELIGEDE
jgi:uncharacterized Zn ribbon protein